MPRQRWRRFGVSLGAAVRAGREKMGTIETAFLATGRPLAFGCVAVGYRLKNIGQRKRDRGPD